MHYRCGPREIYCYFEFGKRLKFFLKSTRVTILRVIAAAADASRATHSCLTRR